MSTPTPVIVAHLGDQKLINIVYSIKPFPAQKCCSMPAWPLDNNIMSYYRFI